MNGFGNNNLTKVHVPTTSSGRKKLENQYGHTRGIPKAVSIFLLVGGIALIMVPKWMRWAIAVVMITLGLMGLFPELIPQEPTG